MAEDTSFFGSIGNAFSGALGKAKESVSGATAGVGNALGLKAADTNAADTNAAPAPSAPLTATAGRRRVRKTKKGSSRRRRHSRASRRKMSRSNK